MTPKRTVTNKCDHKRLDNSTRKVVLGMKIGFVCRNLCYLMTLILNRMFVQQIRYLFAVSNKDLVSSAISFCRIISQVTMAALF